MSAAIFLTPRGNGGGYQVEISDDWTGRPAGTHRLGIVGKYGDMTTIVLSNDDWVELRDRIDHMLDQR